MLRVNLASDDTVLRERLRIGADRSETLSLTFSENPLQNNDFDAFVLPTRALIPFLEAFVPSVPILAYGVPEALAVAYHAGCDDYLKDPWTYEELECRLKRFNELSIGKEETALSLHRESIGRKDRYVGITEEEYRILRAFANSSGGAVSRTALQFALSGRATPGSRAIDVHISCLRKKIRALFPENQGLRIFISSRMTGYKLDLSMQRKPMNLE
jgi:DNA-binding winged helix-turn-helix (wHTH) protein